jgi:hypothetical protein
MSVASVSLAPPRAASAGALRRSFGRRKFDKQPTQPVAVLIATEGHPIPSSVLKAARTAAAGGAIGVVTVARVHGSAFGLPNPGLMPSRREMAEQRSVVEKAVASLERAGVETWAQVAVSRRISRTIAAVAEARGARQVMVVRPVKSGWRLVVEGDVVKEVSRKLGPSVPVEGITP